MTVQPLRAAAAAWRRTRRHVELHPFRGYGTPTRLLLRGRVLRSTGLTRSRLGDTVGDNLRNMFRRFQSDEVPGALVVARAGGAEARVRTDGEGYFDVALELPEPLSTGASGSRSTWSCWNRRRRPASATRRGRSWSPGAPSTR